jgi:hypothetical protein
MRSRGSRDGVQRLGDDGRIAAADTARPVGDKRDATVMQFPPPGKSLSVRQARRTAVVLWAALFGGVHIFLGVGIFTTASTPPPTLEASILQTLFCVNLGVLLVAVPGGYIARGQIYKRHWEGQVVKPEGYFTGNLLLWAACEGTALFSIVVVLLSHRWWPYIAPGATATLVHIINFPHGRPMFPPENRYAGPARQP